MRTHISFLASLALTVAAFVAPASAQDTRFVVHVPFAFKAGKAELPAGDYRVQRQSSSVIALRNVDTTDAAYVIAQPVNYDDPSASAALVFNRYDGTFFLAQVRSFEGSSTYRLAPSQQERQMAAINAPTVVAVHTRSN